MITANTSIIEFRPTDVVGAPEACVRHFGHFTTLAKGSFNPFPHSHLIRESMHVFC
jgi:hypothetical protein